MNSDPHDSTAWRSFGMLDADESAAFDEATRNDSQLKTSAQEMDRLQAALSLVASRPVMPREGHLERIHARLGKQPKRSISIWLGVSGWAAAAALALLMAWNSNIIRFVSPEPASVSIATTQSLSPALGPHPADEPSRSPTNDTQETTPGTAHTPDAHVSSQLIRRETDRLARDIASLQEQLRFYQLRDQKWFQAVPGMATPVIMVMSPPGLPESDAASIALMDTSPVSQLLVDSLRIASTEKQPTTEASAVSLLASNDPVLQNTDATPLAVPEKPSAIPIYDAARDTGTIVISHLPPVSQGMEYNLWVQSSPDQKPVRLGILPNAGTSSSESFDFSLGTNTVLPSGFVLTQDPENEPSDPSETNTVLESPKATDP